jgi:ABC-type transporter Mla subunit MlaD
MSRSLYATIVALRHVEDEVSLAREKPSRQALDTIAQALPNVNGARERLCRAAKEVTTPLRRLKISRAINHIDSALNAARRALEPGSERRMRSCLNDVVEHLVIATACAEDE